MWTDNNNIKTRHEHTHIMFLPFVAVVLKGAQLIKAHKLMDAGNRGSAAFRDCRAQIWNKAGRGCRGFLIGSTIM